MTLIEMTGAHMSVHYRMVDWQIGVTGFTVSITNSWWHSNCFYNSDGVVEATNSCPLVTILSTLFLQVFVFLQVIVAENPFLPS
jgi:hypothetical protein